MTEENKLPEENEVVEVKKKRKFAIRKSTLIIVLILMFVIGTGSGILISNAMLEGGDYHLVYKEDFKVLDYMYDKYLKAEQLTDLLKEKYYKEISDEDIMEGIYKGIFESTGDPYTTYLSNQEFEDLLATSTGDFYGVGVTMMVNDDNQIEVVNLSEGAPAQRGGIEVGDIITGVDGVEYDGDTFDKAASEMRGELNTEVTITYQRNGESYDVTLVRKKITVPSVYSEMLDDNIGYIQITAFELATDEDFEKELRNFEMQGVDGVVIDLRNNLGGIVESGVAIADMLLPEGTIAYLEDNKGERTYYNSDANCTSLPYVVLVNGASASTSEIVTAAMKDHGVDIVGTTTYGKGVVQSVEQLADESGGIRVTIMQYYSPKGNVIHDVGITPTHIVELTEEDTTDTQLEKAVSLLKK